MPIPETDSTSMLRLGLISMGARCGRDAPEKAPSLHAVSRPRPTRLARLSSRGERVPVVTFIRHVGRLLVSNKPQRRIDPGFNGTPSKERCRPIVVWPPHPAPDAASSKSFRLNRAQSGILRVVNSLSRKTSRRTAYDKVRGSRAHARTG